MINKFKLISQIAIIFTIIFSFQACTLKVPLKTVEKSENIYVPSIDKKDAIDVSFKDGLGENRQIVTGIFEKAIFLENNKKSIQSYPFISNAIKSEIQSRKLPIKFVDTSKKSLVLKKFEIFTHRSSGFSPIVTISMLKVTGNIGNEEKIFTSIIKRGKVPIWAAEEINDPCFNEPIMLMVKEVVAKINKEYFNYKLSDKKVAEIVSKIENGVKTKDSLNYINMYELGFSNNAKALDIVKSYNNSSDEYLRLSSIAVLGLLGGEKEFSYLTNIYRNAKLWQDRAMALKAIADIGTEETNTFIKRENNLWKTQDTKEGKWNNMLLDLYEKN